MLSSRLWGRCQTTRVLGLRSLQRDMQNAWVQLPVQLSNCGCGTYFKFNHTNTQKNRLTLRLYRTTSPVRSLVPSGPAAPPPKAQAKPSLRRAVPPSTHATSAVLRGESAGWKSGSSTLFESSKSGSSVASRVACWAKCGGGRRLGRRLGEWGARDVLQGPGGASSALLE